LAYVSLYRKYRSQTFGDLMGQDHVVRTLQNGITSGRIAHAYLFTGPRGTGKTSTARLLAKALCCEKGPTAEPCNVCDICVSITNGSCIDVFEMDAASESGVEDVRETIIQVTEYVPAMCRYKVFIIDEVHDLSTKAFDALLKTIEEPPPHIIFVLATTEFNKLPPTIRSRCQKFEFHRASVADIAKRLEYVAKEEGVTLDSGSLYAICRMADGGFRDALTLLEQVIISSPSAEITLQDVYEQLGLVTEEITDQILTAMQTADIAQLTTVLNELSRVGRDPRAIVESLLYRLADLTRIAYGVDSGIVDGARQAASHELAVRLGSEKLLSIRSALAQAHRTIRDISLPRLWLESELIRVAQSVQVSHATHAAVSAPAPKAAPAPPAPPPEAAKPQAPQPMATPEPEIPEPVAAIEPSGNPELDKAREIWAKAIASLPSNTPIYLKLSDSAVSDFTNGVITVEMTRNVDRDWITDNTKSQRQAHILKELHRCGGEGWTIKFELKKGGPKNLEPVAVELPAEGQKLAQIAREVFGS
jgi:DNA polymerase-3 subunit gamma/tau